MKNLKAVLLFIFAISLFSCDNNDELLVDPTSEYDAELIVTEDGVGNVLNASIDITDKHDLKVKVTFLAEEKKMRRLYITENVLAGGVELYTPNIKFDSKKDGSIDLETKYKKEVEFIIPITAPQIADGTVVYKFWTTSNRGDIRDESKNLSLGTATLTLNYGSKTNAQAPVKEFTARLLASPLADASSKTFMSLLDGEVYKISEGVEYIAFWDFGFLYGKTTEAGLYSISNYPSSGFNSEMRDFIEDNKAELNVTKFKLSTISVAEFAAIEKSEELDILINTEAIESRKVQKLKVDDVIEFVDNYGKKGLIKVSKINPSAGSKGFIEIDVKVQA